MSNSGRISRLIRLLELFRTGSGYGVAQICELCDISRRTFFRDLKALRESGVPIVFDEQTKLYNLPAPTDPASAPLELTREEALLLNVLCRELGRVGSGLPFFEPAAAGARKLTEVLPAELRVYVDRLGGRVGVHLDPQSRLDHAATAYRSLLDAMEHGRVVRVVYRSLVSDELGEFVTELSPYRLRFQRRSWFVIGFSAWHQEVRTFNMTRMREVALTDQTFEVPTDFDPDDYLANAWNIIPEPDARHEVVVRFQPKVAHNVAEVRWHHTQHSVWNADGTLDYHVVVDGLGEITWWILGYGEQAEVLEPPELREEIQRRGRAMLARYTNDDADSV